MLKEFIAHIQETTRPQIIEIGGMWKLKARETVKAFLEERLAEEVSAEAVIVAL